MSETGYIYSIIDYKKCLAYFKINFKMIVILNYCPWTSSVLL